MAAAAAAGVDAPLAGAPLLAAVSAPHKVTTYVPTVARSLCCLHLPIIASPTRLPPPPPPKPGRPS